MRKIVLGFLIFIVIVEVGFRLSGRLRTYSEKNFDSYQSAYNSKGASHLFVWNKNDTINSQEIEFTYNYKTNSYGLVDEHLLDTCDIDSTIVFLGDSFVFGVGAPQDSSLPVLLSHHLRKNVINAGIPGSDPFYQKKLMDSVFIPKGFKNYFFMLNFSDVYDFVIRRGEERFLAENRVVYRKAPWFEPFYHYSYCVRAIVHVALKRDYSLLPQNQLQKLKDESIIAYASLFQKIARNNNITVIFQPYARQYANNDKVLNEVLNYKYLEQLEKLLRSKKIKTINLNATLKDSITNKNYLEYSWNLDGHFNSKGYELLSRVINDTLMKKSNSYFTKGF